MRDMVLATIAEQPDIEVVGEAEAESGVTELVERTRPDFLIMSLEDQDTRPALCGFLHGR